MTRQRAARATDWSPIGHGFVLMPRYGPIRRCTIGPRLPWSGAICWFRTVPVSTPDVRPTSSLGLTHRVTPRPRASDKLRS
jgi:hypothetical protein